MRRSKSTEPRLALQSPPTQRYRILPHTRRPRNGGSPPSPRPYLYNTQSHMIGWARPMRGGERRDVVATNARESRLLRARSGLAALSV